MTKISERDLIIRLQAGDLEALGKLFDRYNRMVYRTALAIAGEREAAADLLQEVFLRLYRFADKADPSRPLEPWLYRMTVNLTSTWVRRRKWLQPLEEIAEWLSGEAKDSPAQMAEAAEDLQRLEHALAALPLSQRTVIVLYYLNDLSLQEIAEVLEVPVGTVKSRLHYGRRGLRKHLTEGEEGRPEAVYEFT